MRVPTPSFAHLVRMTDTGGLYEHAEGTTPRPEHAYCVDDVARALVVLCREGSDDAGVVRLRDQYLTFVLVAHDGDGRFHNRRGLDQRWLDEASVEDCWGRALWGLGTAAACDDVSRRIEALAAFNMAASRRSPHVRAMTFAALGAAEVLRVIPDHPVAAALLHDAAIAIGRPSEDAAWRWPEARLSYANAALAEVLLVAGEASGDQGQVEDGLLILRWLLELQTADGHLSVVPVGGRGPADSAPGFDQQPIEVAAFADACVRAHSLAGQSCWLHAFDLAVGWFLGNNDGGIAMYDESSGGGFDGLERDGRNENQGAESTLAALSTLQQARRLTLATR